jgi:hypothetical protein
MEKRGHDDDHLGIFRGQIVMDEKAGLDAAVHEKPEKP